ncbi:MAG: hypothetical protein U0271_25960 [Polyangiaceae bacterium]
MSEANERAVLRASKYVVGVVRRGSVWGTLCLIVATVWALVSWWLGVKMLWRVGGALTLVAMPIVGWLVERLQPTPVSRVAKRLRRRASAAQDFKAAAVRGDTVVCEGELVVLTPTSSPLEGTACAAYFAHETTQHWVEAVAGVGQLVLRTEAHGELELVDGRWRLESNFDPAVSNGESLLQGGERVLVEGLATPSSTQGYRGEVESFSLKPSRLRRRPTRIVPASGAYSATSTRTRRAAVDHWSVLLVFIVGAITALPGLNAKPTPDAPRAASAAPCGSGERSVGGACKTACDAAGACADGKVCDAEQWTCETQLAGTKKEGETCQKYECGAGLRCRADLIGGGPNRQCVRACESNAQCAADEWCVPCKLAGMKGEPGDCIKRAKVTGAVQVMCEALTPASSAAPR